MGTLQGNQYAMIKTVLERSKATKHEIRKQVNV